MIVKLNGSIMEPESGGGFMDSLNQMADNFVSWEVESLLKPVGEIVRIAISSGFHGIAEIMPELAVIGVITCVTIGMFTKFSKWLGRAVMIYLGGAVWIILASAK